MLSPPEVEICSHTSSPQSCRLSILWAAPRRVSWHEDSHGTIAASSLVPLLLQLPWINDPSLHCCPKLLGQF